MAQDYYFNSHNPNNANNGGTPPQKKPPQRNNSAGDKKRAPSPNAQAKRGIPLNGNPPRPAAQPPQKKAPSNRPPLVRSNPELLKKDLPKKKKPSRPPVEEQPGMSKTKLNILRAVFGGLVVCAFTVLVVGLTVLIYSINTVNGDIMLDLDTEKYAQAQTTFVYGKNEAGEEIELARMHGTENRIWVDMENMSPYMKDAFIALEDKRFNNHHGVDWFRTLSAIFYHGGNQGGSTITQQLVKNLTNQKSITYVRKFNEILTALNLEKHFEKDEIIEAYMNTIYLSEGCYGVQTAAVTYFGKDVSELNLAECATIAAITQFPSKYDPLRATRTVLDKEGNEKIIDYVAANKERQEMCLLNMLKQGKITQAEYDEAMAYKLVFTNSPEYTGKSALATAATDKNREEKEYNSYYVDFVIEQVAKELAAKEGIRENRALKRVISGGYKIYAAMDYTVQKTLEDVYENYTTFADREAQSAMTVMDYKGRVVGLVGGAGEKNANMILNRAESKRPPGSTIKPLSIYAPALELNAITWSKIYRDSPSRKSEEEPLLKGSGWPHNDSNEGGGGTPTTVQKGLQRSFNTIPVQILTEIQFEASKTFLEEKAHLTTLDENDAAYGPLALGSLTNGATVLEMTTAYQMFGNGGYYYKPYAYTKVVNSKNEIVLESKPEETKEQVLSPANATVMNKMLQTVAASGGTGYPYRLNGNYEMIAKTGTTTGSKDRWFIAGTPYYVAAVWYGYDTPKTIETYGYNPAGRIWQAVMNQIHKAKDLSAQTFEISPEAVQRKYCTESGLLAGKGCTRTLSGWYASNNLPGYCNQQHSGGSDSNTNSNTNSSSNNQVNNNVPTTEAPVAPPETTTAPNSGGDNNPSEGDNNPGGNEKPPDENGGDTGEEE